MKVPFAVRPTKSGRGRECNAMPSFSYIKVHFPGKFSWATLYITPFSENLAHLSARPLPQTSSLWEASAIYLMEARLNSPFSSSHYAQFLKLETNLKVVNLYPNAVICGYSDNR